MKEEEYWVYVLRNPTGRHYIGVTNDPARRLDDHNAGRSKWTSKHGPWEMVWHEGPMSLGAARKKEMWLKRQKGGRGFYRLTGLRWQVLLRHRQQKGLKTFAPVLWKSCVFRVTKMSRWASAVAAIIPSRSGNASPLRLDSATNFAQQRATAASQGRHSIVLTRFENQRSSWVRLRPGARQRIPISSSPRTMGSTPRSPSLATNQATTFGSGLGRVGSLSTFASTRYFIPGRAF